MRALTKSMLDLCTDLVRRAFGLVSTRPPADQGTEVQAALGHDNSGPQAIQPGLCSRSNTPASRGGDEHVRETFGSGCGAANESGAIHAIKPVPGTSARCHLFEDSRWGSRVSHALSHGLEL
jgi:hypothetical protein